MASVLEKIQEITAEKLSVEIEDIKPESSFTEDLEADSLDVVELIMALEEEFSTDDNTIEISDEDAENIRTVQNAVDFITSKGIE
ncbi:MAG: acyl carrier protein [Chloroflexi bacterium]|nr:acyl carrier protein [Chloroflexota bacterium]|tara:strand:+ start:2184 stop:2438 length:255 start_codon:yes stop_codon:yes gene_type:complete